MIASIIANGLSRRILVFSDIEFSSPTDAIRELWRTRAHWNKRGLPQFTLNEIADRLFRRIKFVEAAEYSGAIREAYGIMKPIDEEDTPFLALGIHLNLPIWSDDKHLQRQKRIRTYSTDALGRLLQLI